MPRRETIEDSDYSDSDDDSAAVGGLEPGSDDSLYFGVGRVISGLRKRHGPTDYALKSLRVAK